MSTITAISVAPPGTTTASLRPPAVPDLGLQAQVESLYAEREQLFEVLGCCDADEVIALVETLRRRSENLARLLDLAETEQRLAREAQAVRDEISRLQADVRPS